MTAPWIVKTVTAGTLPVRYLDAGSGRPLVLLHGGLATAEMSWTTPYRLLVGDHRIVAPDTRAHGGTPNPDGPLTYPRLADDVAAVITALDLHRPVLIGHSDGAQTALEFGRRHPGVAAGIVLSGTVSEPTQGYVDGIREWGFTGPAEVDLGRIAVEFGEDLEPTRAAHEHVHTDADWARFLADIATLWHTVPAYTDAELAEITDPTLVITADGDELSDVTQAQRLRAAIPGAQLAVIPDAGHGAADEPIFWAIVSRFVAGLGG